ncbi:unnamed protein product [Polarella glacialis]|uniref:Uncharacterized protein n=1 Tax=Polarella glacialis TaxID=89957 RepID=A0A813FMH9_POLGL|nr:unnamed protein product [Polarella glacialis]CAE8678861.1 unnamed protein product [Polarella glacialis]
MGTCPLCAATPTEPLLDGCQPVTAAELGDFLESKSSFKAKEAGGGEKSFMINLDMIHTILLSPHEGTTTMKEALRLDERQATGFISMEEVSSALDKTVKFEDPAVEQLAVRSDPVVDRSGKVRKSTGFISKAQLLNILEQAGDEEITVRGDEEITAPTTGPPETQGGGGRSKTRKGTGFVSRASLQKVLEAAGEEDDD